MATRADRENEQSAEEAERLAREELAKYEISYEEGWKLLDAEARRYLNMSGEEFVRKWDAGEIDFDDPETHNAVVGLWMLLPMVRPETADS